jgi:hypothetical protein
MNWQIAHDGLSFQLAAKHVGMLSGTCEVSNPDALSGEE